MIICLLGLLFLELLLLGASIIKSKSGDSGFQITMSIILSFVYLVTMVVYIPLFTTIMERLRVAFPSTYNALKVKVTIGFVAFMLLMLMRYLIYLCLQF